MGVWRGSGKLLIWLNNTRVTRISGHASLTVEYSGERCQDASTPAEWDGGCCHLI